MTSPTATNKCVKETIAACVSAIRKIKSSSLKKKKRSATRKPKIAKSKSKKHHKKTKAH